MKQNMLPHIHKQNIKHIVQITNVTIRKKTTQKHCNAALLRNS